MKKKFRLTMLIGIVSLYVAAVPWFREAGATPSVVFGLPDWTAWALLCFLGVAMLNAVAWWLTDLEGQDDSQAGDEPASDEDSP